MDLISAFRGQGSEDIIISTPIVAKLIQTRFLVYKLYFFLKKIKF